MKPAFILPFLFSTDAFRRRPRRLRFRETSCYNPHVGLALEVAAEMLFRVRLLVSDFRQ
jgi:hypothetical protein